MLLWCSAGTFSGAQSPLAKRNIPFLQTAKTPNRLATVSYQYTRLRRTPFVAHCTDKKERTVIIKNRKKREGKAEEDEEEINLKVDMLDIFIMSWLKLSPAQKAWSVVAFIAFLYLLPRLFMLLLIIVQRTTVSALLVLEEMLAAALLQSVVLLSILAGIGLVGYGIYIFFIEQRIRK